jgi:hypothetical protein
VHDCWAGFLEHLRALTDIKRRRQAKRRQTKLGKSTRVAQHQTPWGATLTNARVPVKTWFTTSHGSTRCTIAGEATLCNLSPVRTDTHQRRLASHFVKYGKSTHAALRQGVYSPLSRFVNNPPPPPPRPQVRAGGTEQGVAHASLGPAYIDY